MERMFTHGGSGPSPSNAHRSASLREIDEKEEDGGGGGKLYVAVGKDLKDGRSNLLWAARSLLASDLKLVLLHVHQPAERIMTELCKVPASQLEEKKLKAYRTNEKEEMNTLLNHYLDFCRVSLKMQAETLVIEKNSPATGIIELIDQNHITKLVMGTSSVSVKRTAPKSKLSAIVHLQAKPYCQIFYICKEALACSREANQLSSKVEPSQSSCASSVSDKTEFTPRSLSLPPGYLASLGSKDQQAFQRRSNSVMSTLSGLIANSVSGLIPGSVENMSAARQQLIHMTPTGLSPNSSQQSTGGSSWGLKDLDSMYGSPAPVSVANSEEYQRSMGKMKDRNSLWLPAAETDIPITTWIDTVMEGPVTASLGPMAPLLRQVHSLSAMAPGHIQGGSEDDVKRLKENLEVLCRDLLEPEETSLTPKWWRKEVRELLYDTEDLLDEIIIFQAGDFSELIAGLEDACERRKRLQLAPNKITKPDLGEAGLSYFTSQQTSVELSKPISVQGHSAGLGIVGIEDPMSKLVEQLAFDDDKQKRLKVTPIVGFPGVGKTTVAGILYYEYRGKFQCSAFVRVSRTPDMRSLLISILSQIKSPGLCGFPDVHDLIDGIRKYLKGKRYFIVMDDLWTAPIWDIISRAFPDDDCSSRIITTTQIDDVALACCRYYPDYIEISPLNDDQSKELFFTRVFGSKDHCPPDFKKVSCKIINKCAGLPLAIVSIASLLASESYLIVEKWEHIQDSLSCMRTNPISEGEKGLSSDTAIGSGARVLARGPKIEKWKRTQDSLPFTSEWLKQVLNLVYNNLPPHLKACLLYLCMYPEGYLIRKHDLVRQWVAEDFVIAMGGRGAEETAGVYFDELVSRGMVQSAVTNYSNEVSYTVHHMVLDLIRHKSKELNFIITVDTLQSTLALPDEVRRLSIQFGGSKGADVPENVLISKVRSLLFWGFFECVPLVVDYGLLRVLILHIWADGDETSFDLTTISELLLLRYLKIQCNIMVNLPDEIKGLKCLETLEVDARLSAVPCDIGHLKLLHLLLPSEAILPKGLDGLTSLLTLGCFDLSKNSTQNVIDLAKLTNLQEVHLTYSTEPSELPVGSMEHLGSILEKFNDLRSLTLHGAGSSSQIISDDGLSIVSPSPALLEKLELLPRICILSRLPKWIGELSRLSILKIEVLDLLINDIAILKELASLASLSLYVRTEHAEWTIFNEGFPVLNYFKFVRTAPYMSFLEGAMPNVQKLELAFDANRLKPECRPGTFGFQHMKSLTKISVNFGDAGADDSNKRETERVWKDAFANHPNNPNLDTRWVDCIFNGDKN